MTDPGPDFLAQSRTYLTGHYLPKILAALDPLSDDDLWWRPNEASNSIGNILLHLAGNIRQWIVSGVGGAPDKRDRAAEFSRREPLPRGELLARFTEAVLEADGVIAGTDPGSLGERRAIQGRAVTVQEAIYHVVEHLAMHAGQVLWISKARSGRDLGFYRNVDGVVRPSWPGHPTTGGA